MIVLAYILSSLSLLLSALFFVREGPPPEGFRLMFARLIGSTLSPLWAIIGLAGALLGWVYQAIWAIPLGLVGAGLMIAYVWQCSRDHGDFEKAFGADWADQIPREQAQRMVKRRWALFLRLNAAPEPIWERDVPYWTIPDPVLHRPDRELRCDLWRPADGNVSGLAFIYLHGSAWAMGDKDMLTRPFFRHLVSQGHTVMDLSYRLIPEADIYGMVGDAKRAVAWMKANADRYGIDPKKVVLAGGSAGGHVALLAGYTPEHPELTPEDVEDTDLSVCGLVSLYGPTDLRAEYEHYMWKDFYSEYPAPPIGTVLEPNKQMNYAGRLDILLGGHPEDVPHIYELASPICQVQPACPPTLLIQGETDLLVPADATRELYAKLVECGVPAINIIFPWTDHAFDLPLPQVSPTTQSALYDVDRFLALLLNTD